MLNKAATCRCVPADKPGLAPTSELPFLNMLESLSSSAVRVAGKVAADLIIVYTATGAPQALVVLPACCSRCSSHVA